MDLTPETRQEQILSGVSLEPITRLEWFLQQAARGGGGTVPIDSLPTEGSRNAVSSGGVYAELQGKASVEDLTDYATTAMLNNYATTAELSQKADASSLDDYATKSELAEYPTDEDVESAIADAIGGITRFEYYLCGNGEYDAQTGVPTIQNPDTNHIYLVPTSGTNLNMYAYVNSQFTFLGTTEMDLSGYVQESDLADVATSGSYEDLSDTPTIPTKLSDLTNDMNYASQPGSVYFSRTVNDWSSTGETDVIIGATVNAYYVEADADEIAGVSAAAKEEETVYFNDAEHVGIKMYDDASGIYIVGYNVEFVGGSLEIVDNTKPCAGIYILPSETPAKMLLIAATNDFPVTNNTWKLFTKGVYLTDDDVAAVALSGNYNDLRNKPTIPSVPTTVSSFTNDSLYLTPSDVSTVAISGKYKDLTGKPTLATVATSGAYSDLSGKPNLATVATSGSYNDLSNKPNLATVATSGSYSDLSNKPNLATVATSGSYNDLSNKPSNLVTGKNASGTDTAYTLKISTTAPASGTASNIITIVIPS